MRGRGVSVNPHYMYFIEDCSGYKCYCESEQHFFFIMYCTVTEIQFVFASRYKCGIILILLWLNLLRLLFPNTNSIMLFQLLQQLNYFII